jgi:hypothetical protein
MSNADGKLTDADVLVVASWLMNHATGGKDWDECPFCRQKKLEIGQHLIHLQIFVPPHKDGAVIGTSPFISYPQVQVVCENCGHTLFFSAVMAGLLPKREASNG